jgi:NitT/TauT family transport system substrate-binding protein
MPETRMPGKRLLVLAGAAALVAAGTSACSSSGGGGGGGKGGSGLTSITIADTSPGAGYSDLELGVADGIFKKHGLNVSLKHLPDSSQLVPALLSGSVQIGVGVASTTAGAIMQGEDLRFVAMSEPHYNLEMWASPKVADVAALKGKKVAITSPGSEADFGLTDLLERDGLKRSDVTTEYVKSVPGEISALQSNAVDAILTQPPNGTQTRAKGYHRIAELSDLPFALGAYTVSGDYLKGHESTIQKFVAAETENLARLHQDRAEALKIIEKYSGTSDPTLAAYSYDFFLKVWSEVPTVPANVIQAAFAQAAAKNHKTAPTDVSKYIDNSFVDALQKDGTIAKLYPNGTGGSK